ncbi:MAG: TonB-dependent receptor [Flavobacteriales bacterium]|nr:TonB-dependent receptor [Flavobacteriales bacterium]MCB9448114.1 TonB-dependent receptor [Flavobacteriales bacterium]
MRVVFTSLLLIAGFTRLFAVEPPKGSVTGSVMSASEGQPVEFATVSVHNVLDSVLVSGTVTDAQGGYVIKDLPEGKYFLRIGFIGYNTQEVSDVNISSKNWHVTVPAVKLQEMATALQEVAVTADRSLVENHIDKKVFNAEKSMASQGGTGLDLMKEVPSVDVDADENISLRGDGNVKILVDGRPLTVPASQYLKQLPANAIERVEVVTNPSAKYDPEGMSGILNIILKKQKQSGFNGSVNLSAGRGKRNKGNAGINLNYRKDKFNYTFGYNQSRGEGWFGGEIDRSFVLRDTLFGQIGSDEGAFNFVNHWLQGGVDFFLNDRNTFYVSANGQFNDNQVKRHYDNAFLEADEVSYTSNRESTKDVNGQNTKVNAGWQKKFKKKGQSYDLDVEYSVGNNPTTESNLETFDPLNSGYMFDMVSQRVSFKDLDKLFNVRNDFVLPVNDSIRWETGVHYTGTWLNENVYSERLQSNSGEYEPDTAINNEFNYAQHVGAVYGIYHRQQKKWGYQFGLRVEKTLVDAELLTTDQSFTNTYTSFFPSAHVSYKIKEMDELSFSYSRRINRPDPNELNPFPSSSDPYTVMMGNPFLKPEFIHVFEVGYLKYWEKFNVNGTVYYRHVNDMKRRFLDLTDEGVSVVSFDNLSTGHLYGVEAILTYNPAKWNRNTLTLNAWQNQLEDPAITENLSTTNEGWSATLASSLNLPKNLSLQVNGNYRSRMVVVQGTLMPRYTIDFSARKSIWKNKASISVRVSDIFQTGAFRFKSKNLINYDFEIDRRWESQQFWLTFTYNFGKMQRGGGRRTKRVKDASDNFSTPDMN